MNSKSDFYTSIQKTFGGHIGNGIAASAEGTLKRWGLDPYETSKLPQGFNAILFNTKEGLLIKIQTELEHHGQLPLNDTPGILGPLKHTNIGFDMGGAAITMEVHLHLNIYDVKPHHVQALCYHLQQHHGLIFSDNKCENVALAADGTPYVIDAGSVRPQKTFNTYDKLYFYPQLSGYDEQRGKWQDAAPNHGFYWPVSHKELPEFQNASEILGAKQAIMKI